MAIPRPSLPHAHAVDPASMGTLAGAKPPTTEISDDFSGDLSKWTQDSGTWSISAGQLQETAITDEGTIRYTDAETPTISQYAKVKVVQFNEYGGLAFRCAGSSYYYSVDFHVASGQCFWRVLSYPATWDENVESHWDLSFSDNDTIGAEVTGTGNSTVVKIWKNPSGDTPSEWGSEGLNFTNNPTNAADSGKYIGIVDYNGAGETAIYDDFSGGSS